MAATEGPKLNGAGSRLVLEYQRAVQQRKLISFRNNVYSVDAHLEFNRQGLKAESQPYHTHEEIAKLCPSVYLYHVWGWCCSAPD
jgi:hypothetical protein